MNWSLIHEPGANGRSPGETVKKQFKNKLQQIVQNPRIESTEAERFTGLLQNQA